MNEIYELVSMAKQVGLTIDDAVLNNFSGTTHQLAELLIKMINLKIDGKINLASGENVINLVNLGKVK